MRSISNNIILYEPNERIFGKSWNEWIVRYWQWIVSIPKERNPLLDNNGEYCNEAQDYPIWFLVDTTKGSVERR